MVNNNKSGEIRSASVPPFLKKCYEIVDDGTTDAIISWSENSDSFVIWDMTQFSVRLLPLYFKHGNFSSFMRQLNIYGFRKIDTDRWEFANDGFVRGQNHLLKNICRRKNVNGPDQKKALQQEDNSDGPCDKTENIGLWKEVENLKIDKNAIMQEFIKLRQHQETAGNKLLLFSDRLQGMEKNQQQMLSFLVMAVQNPGFLVQLLKPKEKNWRMAEAGNMLEEGTEDDRPIVSDGMIVRYQPLVDEIPKPVHTQIPGPEKQPKANPSPDGMNDFILNPDFLKILMDDKLCSLDNFILPDLPDDGAWEQLLLSSPFSENTEDTKLDTEGTETEMESTETENQFKNSQNFELLMEQMEKSQNLELLTDQMELLSSDPDYNYGSQ